MITQQYRAFREDEHIKYCFVGQKVYAHWEGTVGVLCTVTKAAEDMAFIENEEKKVACWRSIYSLYPAVRPIAER